MRVLDVAEVIQLEQKAVEAGTPLLELMNRAGAAVAQAAQGMLARAGCECGQHVVILAGTGNNGGDGWVAASELVQMEHDVTLVSKLASEDLTAEPAKFAAESAVKAGGFDVLVSPGTAQLKQLLDGADLIIDAILGTGFTHASVRAPFDEWISLANQARETSGVPVLAVDCPSGLDAQTGSAASSCIRADETITMIALKRGLVTRAAAPYVGHLQCATLGVNSGEIALQLDGVDVQIIRKHAKFEGKSGSDSIRDTLSECIEDQEDLEAFRKAIREDDGVRYSHADVLKERGL